MLQFRTPGTIDLRSDEGERIEGPLLHSKQLALLAYLCGRHLLLAAGVRAALGERDAAVETLQRAFAAGLPYTIELHALPMVRPPAREPGFRTLLAPRG